MSELLAIGNIEFSLTHQKLLAFEKKAPTDNRMSEFTLACNLSSRFRAEITVCKTSRSTINVGKFFESRRTNKNISISEMIIAEL